MIVLLDIILFVSETVICVLVALALTEFMFFFLRKMGVIKTTSVPTQPTSEPNPLHAGDVVVLKPDNNPYKGCLKCTVPYLVLTTYPKAYSTHIRLRGDNGTEGWYPAEHFKKYDGTGKTMPIDLSGEYDEAIRAQEIMEDVSNR